jgi:hypothetical protein
MESTLHNTDYLEAAVISLCLFGGELRYLQDSLGDREAVNAVDRHPTLLDRQALFA